MKRWILSAVLCCTATIASAAEEPLVFAVNEGTTYRVSSAETKAKYHGLADDLARRVMNTLHQRGGGAVPCVTD